MKLSESLSTYLFILIGSICLYDCCSTSDNKSSNSKTESAYPFTEIVAKNDVSKQTPKVVSFSNPLHCFYRVTSSYGYRTNPVSGNYKCHDGIDLACSRGTPVYASMNGTITSRSYNSIYGNYITITHEDGYKTKYAHLDDFGLYSIGDMVSTSTIIGYVGSTGQSTGPHCHFEIIKNGSAINPCTKINF